MNYIYDILLNFDFKYYDFYEWDKNTIHIKKIPTIRINSKQMNDIYNNNVKINLTNLTNKTETFNNKNIYAFIIYCDNFAMAIKLNKEGLVIGRSSLLFEDMESVLNSDRKDITKLNIEIYSKIKYDFLIKKDNEIKEFILKQIDDLIKYREYSKLLYIYYECYNKKEENIDKIIEDIKKVINFNYMSYGNKIYEILNLTINK